MAEAGVETESVADRLEAALERIAALSSRRPAVPVAAPEGGGAPPGSPPDLPMGLPMGPPIGLTDRLDALIATLRQALDGPPA